VRNHVQKCALCLDDLAEFGERLVGHRTVAERAAISVPPADRTGEEPGFGVGR
jgi:hypothetical protein